MKTQQTEEIRELSEPEAWREIARRIAMGKWEKGGLCDEVLRLNYAFEDRLGSGVTYGVRSRMKDRIAAHLALMPVKTVDGGTMWERQESPYWLDKSGYGRNRVLFALLLALEAEDEAAAGVSA